MIEKRYTIRLEMTSMGQQLGALTTWVYAGKAEMEGMKQRIERIEHRLELREAA